MRRTAITVVMVLVLAGCTSMSWDVELPDNAGAGGDEMKSSPCACLPLDYDGRGFAWVGA